MKSALPILAFSLAMLAGCREADVVRAAPPAPVEVAEVEQRDLPIEVPAIGTVEPIATVQLKAKVGGEVQEVNFADGAYVKTGQALFEIDPRSYQASYDRAVANLAIASAQAKNANDQLKRYTTLSDKGAASEEQYAQYATIAQQQEAEVSARRADVAEAKLSLDWATVRAPIDGRAGTALVRAGNIVAAETEVLTVINQLEPIYVAFSIPEDQLAEVRKQMTDRKLTVIARNTTTGETLQEGSLTFVDNSVDTESGMVALKATFANEGETLWPGQFVDIQLALGEQKDALVIPTIAILDSQSGPRVFVIKDDTAELRDVEVDRTFGDLTVVTGGLGAGESVVTTGQLRLIDGAKVKVSPPAVAKQDS